MSTLTAREPCLAWLIDAARMTARTAGFGDLDAPLAEWAALTASPETGDATHPLYAHSVAIGAELTAARRRLPAAGSFYCLTTGTWAGTTIADLPSWEDGGPLWTEAWLAAEGAMKADPLVFDALTVVYPGIATAHCREHGGRAMAQPLAAIAQGMIRIAAYRAGLAALTAWTPASIGVSDAWREPFAAAATAEAARIAGGLPVLPVVTGDMREYAARVAAVQRDRAGA